MSHVVISRSADKALRKMPVRITEKLAAWVRAVESIGLAKVQMYPSYNDEALGGKRKGQHSIRLSLGYRAFYTTHEDGTVQLVTVIDVNKHEY